MLDEARSPPAETMAERHGRLLGRLAELSLAACEDLAARAVAAEEPEVAARLHATFAKAGCSLRQAVMLEAKLAQAAADPRPAAGAAARSSLTPTPSAADRRDAREAYLAEGLEAEITAQLEGPERDERLELLDDLLQAERDQPGFMTQPVAAIALRICDGLGLTFGARSDPATSGPPDVDPDPEPPPVSEPEPDPPPGPAPDPDPPPEPERRDPDPWPDPEFDPVDPPPEPAREPTPVYTYSWDHPRAQHGGAYGGSGW